MKKYASTLAGITPRLSVWLAACVAAPCVLMAAPVWSASFDCSRGGSPNEQLICSDPELSALDDKLGKTFKQARKKAASRHAFSVASDKQWRWREQNCHDRTCLVDWYHRRQTELEAALNAPEDTTQTEVPNKPANPAKLPAASSNTPETAGTPVVAAETKIAEPKVAKPARPAKLPATSSNTPETAGTAVVAAETKTAEPKIVEPKPAKAAKLATATKTVPETRAAQVPPAAAATPAARAAAAVNVTSATPATPARPMLQLQLSPSQIANIAPEGVSARAHYISANKGEYLYADTDPDGDAHSTVSVRYLGTAHGQHIIEVRRKDVYTRYTCSADCALIGKLQLPGDADTDMVILKNDHKSLPSLIVTDALNGLLLESVVVR
jgi:uncharacterized protein